MARGKWNLGLRIEDLQAQRIIGDASSVKLGHKHRPLSAAMLLNEIVAVDDCVITAECRERPFG
jgi:hypothetical protein